MINIITEISKYLMVFLIIVYAYSCFSVFGYHDYEKKERILNRQMHLMFTIHFVAFLNMFLIKWDVKIAGMYGVQVILLLLISKLYTMIYPKVSRLVVNNMCMLLSIGFIMLTRLNYTRVLKQCIFAAVSMAVSMVVPVIIRKVKQLSKLRVLYAVLGILSLGVVAVAAVTSDGAKLGFSFGGVSIQPSELVKIVFVFFVASSFAKSTTFKNVVVTTILAAFHVLILVASRDLGAALIIFVVYLVMLYVATKQPLYMLAGLGSGAVASVAAYHLFGHVRTRVIVWKDPFAAYDNGGQQVAQALMAIGTGSWFGLGLFQGKPESIPVVSEDFIFAAISEEMGLIFALCMILVCLSCYIMFLNIAMQLRDMFYKLVALGLGTCYIFQVFLTIGGVTKFIPLTGVTLPFVSYGGSSILSTFIMFAIIQGLYILREDEEESIEREKARQLQREKRKGQQKRRMGAARKKDARRPEETRITKAPSRRGGYQRDYSIDEEIGAVVRETLREKEDEGRKKKTRGQ